MSPELPDCYTHGSQFRFLALGSPLLNLRPQRNTKKAH